MYEETAPIWWPAVLPEAGAPLRGAHEADVTVVGGGLAGLCAAYYLKKTTPSARVVVLEAERIGAGASGRNGGIVGPGLGMPLGRFRKKFGHLTAVAAFGAVQHGVVLLRELIRAEGIDCDLKCEPFTHAALTSSQARHLRADADILGELGYEVEWHQGHAVYEHAGAGYVAAYSHHTVILVDPYRLLAGLAGVLRRMGVEIYEGSRVLDVPVRNGIPTCVTTLGHLTSERVLLAVDGYAGPLNPYPNRIVAMRGYMLATEPLSASQRAGLGWHGRGGIVDKRRFFNHYRITGDNRLVLGGAPPVVPLADRDADAARAVRLHRRLEHEMRVRFPALAGVAVEARWSGLFASTFDRLPVVGSVPTRDGVTYAGSWCANGLAMSVETAWQFARMSAGRSAPGLPWYRSSGPVVPTKAGRTKGIGAYLRVLDAADRYDLNRAQVPQARADAALDVPILARSGQR